MDSRLARRARKARSVDYKYVLQRENTIFHSFSLQTLTQALTRPPSPSTTTGGHQEPSLLPAKLPHREERFNQNRILRIHLKDSVENNALTFLSFQKQEVVNGPTP